MAGNNVLSATDLERALRAAVDQRARSYSNVIAFTVRFELDDTKAERDAKHFQHITQALGLGKAEEWIIKASDPTPGWTLRPRFIDILTKSLTLSGRSLIIMHYAGHGRLDSQGQLVFQASSKHPRSFHFSDTFLNCVSEESQFSNHNPPVDVVFILDSCYSGSVTRSLDDVSRIVEILAAVEGDKTALGNNTNEVRTQNRTFTSNIADYVARCKGRAETVEFGEMMASLRADSPVKKPVHAVLLGPNSVRLRFPGSRRSLSSPAILDRDTSTATYRALFSIHISDTLTDVMVRDIARWIEALDPSLGIKVEGVYQTNSTGLVVEAPYVVYSKLCSVPGVNLIFEGTQGNRLASPQQLPPVSLSVRTNLQENIRPRK